MTNLYAVHYGPRHESILDVKVSNLNIYLNPNAAYVIHGFLNKAIIEPPELSFQSFQSATKFRFNSRLSEVEILLDADEHHEHRKIKLEKKNICSNLCTKRRGFIVPSDQ